MALKMGLDIFSGSSQAGVDAGIPGDVLLETAAQGGYHLEVQRLSDNFYWNATTEAFQAGRPAQADELEFFGSQSPSGRTNSPAIRRLRMKLPAELIAAATAAGLKLLAYQDGYRGTYEVYAQFDFLP